MEPVMDCDAATCRRPQHLERLISPTLPPRAMHQPGPWVRPGNAATLRPNRLGLTSLDQASPAPTAQQARRQAVPPAAAQSVHPEACVSRGEEGLVADRRSVQPRRQPPWPTIEDVTGLCKDTKVAPRASRDQSTWLASRIGGCSFLRIDFAVNRWCYRWIVVWMTKSTRWFKRSPNALKTGESPASTCTGSRFCKSKSPPALMQLMKRWRRSCAKAGSWSSENSGRERVS